MKDVNRRAIIGLIRMVIALPALVFLPAWTLHYWQAWVCLFTFFASVTVITVYLMKRNPDLLARRMKAGAVAEKERSQKIIQTFGALAFVAVFVVPALDHRYGWSTVPTYGEILGDIAIVVGFAFVFWVFKVNTFTSGVIEVAADQTVITAGPYTLVRHPMYFGSLIMLLGIPLALGSLWGLLSFAGIAAVIVWRILDEEKFLVKNLAGYAAYTEKVRYRLAPLFW